MALLPSLAGGASAPREADAPRADEHGAAHPSTFDSVLDGSTRQLAQPPAQAQATVKTPSERPASATVAAAGETAEADRPRASRQPGHAARQPGAEPDASEAPAGEEPGETTSTPGATGRADGRGRKPTGARRVTAARADVEGDLALTASAPQPRPTAPSRSPAAAVPDQEAGSATAAAARSVARAIGQGARLAQADRQGVTATVQGRPHGRVAAAPAEPRPPQAGPSLEAALARAEGARTPVAGTPSTPGAAAAARPVPVLPLPELPQADLSGAIQLGSAHLRLESSTLGDLALHVRVRGGVAHVRVEGEQATQVAARGLELERALASQGLTLGRLEAEPAQPAPAPATSSGQARADTQGGAGQGGSTAQQDDRPPPQDSTGAPGLAPAQPAARRAAARATVHHVVA